MHNICFLFLISIVCTLTTYFMSANEPFIIQEMFDTTPEDGLDIHILLSESSPYRIVRYPYLMPRGQTYGFGADLQIECDTLPSEGAAYLSYRRAVEEVWSALVTTKEIRPYLYSFPIDPKHLYISLQFLPKKLPENTSKECSFITRKEDSIYTFHEKNELSHQDWQKNALNNRPYPDALSLRSPLNLPERHVSILKVPSFWYKLEQEQNLASFASSFAKETNIEFLNLGLEKRSPLHFLFFSTDSMTLNGAKKLARSWIYALVKSIKHDPKLKSSTYEYLRDTSDETIAQSPILSDIKTTITFWTKEFERPSFPLVAALIIENGQLTIYRATTDGKLKSLFETELTTLLQKK